MGQIVAVHASDQVSAGSLPREIRGFDEGSFMTVQADPWILPRCRAKNLWCLICRFMIDDYEVEFGPLLRQNTLDCS